MKSHPLILPVEALGTWRMSVSTKAWAALMKTTREIPQAEVTRNEAAWRDEKPGDTPRKAIASITVR